MESNTETEEGTSSSSVFLPVEVIENILSRLPVKSLVRFKTVSRSWKAIISHPRFSRIHHHIQQAQNLFYARALLGPADELIKLENQKFRTHLVLECPFGAAFPVCSCNGILLLVLKLFNRNVYVLWNPSIRKCYDKIMCPLRPLDSHIEYGLYHDSRIDDYKVVVISWNYYAVYSCKNSSWAETKPLPFSRTGLYPSYGIFVDGSFYWCNEKSHKEEIVCFDVRDEKLNKFLLPNDLNLANTDFIRLTSLSGRLCLHPMYRDSTKLQLWVMEKHGDQNYSNYSWRELMNMEKEEPQPCYRLYGCVPICLTNEDNVVLSLQYSEFVEYNHSEKSFKKFEVCCKTFAYVFPYSESLYFPIQAEADVED